MDLRKLLGDWPVYRQVTGSDPTGRGRAAMSAPARETTARTESADRVVKSVFPYCAVGCGQQDRIVIEGSNYAEAHPVGFQWVMEAKARGARVIHVHPRFTRTSALADRATIVTARNAIEARAMMTGRIRPLTVHGRTVHQIGLPFHRGPNGITTGDAANELVAVALDPNVHIREDKALTTDIVAGRRPRGPALPEFVAEYRKRAGITSVRVSPPRRERRYGSERQPAQRS